MNAETRHLLSAHLFDQAESARLDEDDRMDSFEEMECQVWGVFEDWASEDYEAASAKLIRIRGIYGTTNDRQN